jgi:hypothetical protein
MVYSSEPGAAGLELEASANGSKVRGKVRETRPEKSGHVLFGALSLPAGPSEITVRAGSRPAEPGAEVRLRYLMLERDFEPLLDGKSLAGWWYGRKDGQGYVVENGMLICPAGGGGNLFSEKEYDHFKLRFEFRLVEGSRSGLVIRSARQTPEMDYDPARDGIKIPIGDDEQLDGKGPSWERTGSIYNVAAARPGNLSKRGEWNTAHVQARGPWIRIELNGEWVVDYVLSEKDSESVKKYPGLARASGHIGFLSQGTRVELRNIRIKKWDPPRKAAGK